MSKQYQKIIWVTCSECNERYDERDCEFENISEDIEGKDVLTFTCPEGHEHQEAYRMG